jgi:wobble nucleotide-excising tRNase
MVDTIQLLRNVGQFDSVTPPQQTAMRKLALIYAENGRGKTTLAAILRSLGTGNTDLVSERHRLGAANLPHVVISAGTETYTFQNGSWSAHLPAIAVFDDHFVSQNVCSGVEIESDHRQNLHELVLGAQGVALNGQLQTHIAVIEAHNRILREREAAIPEAVRGTLTVDQFCALEPKENIDVEIQEAERAVAAAQSAEPVRQQANFQALSLPAFNVDEINDILQRDLPDVQAEAAANVQKHLAKLGRGSEAWIGEGMQKIAAASAGHEREICPFCAQDLEGSEIIAHYQAYFSDAYATLKKIITETGKAVADAHEDEIPAAFERAVRVAVQTAEFWRKFMEVPSFDINTEEVALAWKAARKPVMDALRAKYASPLEKMSLSAEAIAAIAEYERHRTAVAETSGELESRNPEIVLVKERAASGNLAMLTSDLAKLKTIQKRHCAEVAPLCDAYIQEKGAKKVSEGLRDTARAALDQYRETIFTRYETAINGYLVKFGAGFRLSSMASVNNRGGSSCTYSMLINNVAVPIAADRGPSFKNTLSAGDRNTLALAFFFASLDQDPDLANKIVVIDDPMTSLDEHRTYRTLNEIHELVGKVKQVIVLSHAKSFLCDLWTGADKANRSAVQIIRGGQSSVIETWNVHQDCINNNDKNHALIEGYISAGDPAIARPVAVALRNVLEAYIRVAYSSHFPPGSLLGDFYNRCVQAQTAGQPILNAADMGKLRQLSNYANRFHHDTNPAYATELINDQELLDICQKVMQFVRK